MAQFTETKGRIDGSTATFGAPFYGERVLGQLVFGESSNPAADHSHCRDQDYQIPKPDDSEAKTHEKVQAKLINIVIVRRGGCSFVTKVRVAQAKGAHAVVIVDRASSNLTALDIQHIIVADDGYGSQVTVPSILISHAEGEKLILATRQSDPVIVELAWDVPTNQIVQVDLWMSSASQESNRFLKEFEPKRKQLLNALQFTPHYHVFAMAGSNDYHELCSDTSAKYCAEDPDGPAAVTGKMVLDEDVRQMCIHELHKTDKEVDKYIGIINGSNNPFYSAEYWNYVKIFLDECPLEGTKPEKRFGEECSIRVMKKVSIDPNRVAACVSSSYEERLAKSRANTAWSPRAIRINGWRYNGQLDADLVSRAICSGFVKLPAGCQDLPEPIAIQKRVAAVKQEERKTLVPVAIAVIVSTGVALLCYRRSLTKHIHSTLREEVMLEVQAQMDQYNQLSGGS